METLTTKIGGKEYPIPELAVRQLRVIRRPLLDLTAALNAAGEEKIGAKVMALSTEQYEQMTEIVYQGLAAGTKTLTREQFLDMRISDLEMFTAFLVVRQQSGLFGALVKDTAPGEAAAETTETESRTGTA